jgi:hypothetical protein
MRIIQFVIIVFLNSILPLSIFAQSNYIIRGNLIHLNFNDNQINLEDTLGSWQRYKSSVYDMESKYLKVVRTQDSIWSAAESHFSYDSEFLGTYGFSYFLENTQSKRQITYSDLAISDLIVIYYSDKSSIVKIKEGTWFFNDHFGHAFLSYDDQIDIYESFHKNSMLHIIGQVDSLYLTVCADTLMWDIGFYLQDLSLSPQIDLINAKKIRVSNVFKPFKLNKILDNHFIISDERFDKLCLYSLIEDTLIFNKVMLPNTYSSDFDWCCIDTCIYTKSDQKLTRYFLNKTDTTLINEKVIFEGDFSFDLEYKYAVLIKNDSLCVYDLETQLFIKNWDINILDNPKWPIISYPDIFIHQRTNITNIEEQNYIISKTELYPNYPNPFNPKTTISYNVGAYRHKALLNIDLSIYNVIGQKIVTLVNEKQVAGAYKIEWDASKVSSGIYYYRLTTDNGFSQTRKMMILK